MRFIRFTRSLRSGLQESFLSVASQYSTSGSCLDSGSLLFRPGSASNTVTTGDDNRPMVIVLPGELLPCAVAARGRKRRTSIRSRQYPNEVLVVEQRLDSAIEESDVAARDDITLLCTMGCNSTQWDTALATDSNIATPGCNAVSMSQTFRIRITSFVSMLCMFTYVFRGKDFPR